MEKTMSLMDMFHILLKRWKLIVLLILTSTMISGIITYFFITPVYQASTQILVNQKNTQNQFDANLQRSNIELISTYSDIIKSPTILEKVIVKLKLTQSVEELNRNIKVDSQANSQMFSIYVEDINANRAVEIANTVSETFQEEISGIMSVDNVSILAQAKLGKNPTPITPKPVLNIGIGVVIGLMIGVGLTFLLEYLDNTFKNSQDIEEYLGIPVIGMIEEISQEKDKISSLVQIRGDERVEA